MRKSIFTWVWMSTRKPPSSSSPTEGAAAKSYRGASATTPQRSEAENNKLRNLCQQHGFHEGSMTGLRRKKTQLHFEYESGPTGR